MDINTLVLDTLRRAISQDLTVLKEAEQKLQEWETQPGFYSLLKDIFCNRQIEVTLRLIAILLCKNGVEKYWRPNAPNAIQEEEKANIRASIISNFQEPEKQIATHLAVVVAKIARLDWPSWGQLIPTLMNAVKSEDSVSQLVALRVLHQVVKVLSTKCLIPDRKLFQELSPAMFPFISQLCDTHTQFFYMRQHHDDGVEALEKAYLSLKILDKLVIFGFRRPHESNDVNNFIKSLFQKAKDMLVLRSSLNSVLEVIANKYIVKCNNVLLTLLQHHPFSFVEFITPSLEYSVFYAFTPSGEQYLFERFLIQCFNLIKSILLCPEYKPSKSKVTIDSKEPNAVRAQKMKQNFFDTNNLNAICRRLLMHYFLLTPRDLENWGNDPESFATDEGGESWKYSLRPSTETLFATLFHENRNTLTPLMVDLVRENQGIVSPQDSNALLIKDAVYNAVGIAAFDLYDVINFEDWYTTNLQGELAIRDDNYRVIRRRIAWLIGKWTGVRISSDLYPTIYADMIKLLQPEEDMVVRLTAANTIRGVVDDFEFNLESFFEFLEPMFLSLFNLLKQANECDTKMRVLHVLYFIVERVGVSIEPYYNSFVQYLPLLWQETEHHSMLRCAVIATLVHLVRALGKVNESEEAANFILSVISLSTDVRQESHVYLLEDGLELWQCVIENSPYPTSGLLQLFNNMPPLLENNMDHLNLSISVISAYVLLFPDEIFQGYGETLIRIFSDLLTDLRSEGIITIMRLLETFQVVNPSQACSLLKPLLPNIFEIILKDVEFSMLMSVYLSILSRVLLASQEAFIQTITKVGENLGMSPDDVLKRLLEVWLNKMPLITVLQRKKLLALALTSLLVSNFKFVYEKFHDIVFAVIEVLNDITRTDESGYHIDALLYTDLVDSEERVYCDTDHEYRKKQVALRDPVHTIVLEEYFRSQILSLQRDVGPGEFNKFIATLDEPTITQVREYVSL